MMVSVTSLSSFDSDEIVGPITLIAVVQHVWLWFVDSLAPDVNDRRDRQNE